MDPAQAARAETGAAALWQVGIGFCWEGCGTQAAMNPGAPCAGAQAPEAQACSDALMRSSCWAGM